MKQPNKQKKNEGLLNQTPSEVKFIFNVNQAVNYFRLIGYTREAMLIRHKDKEMDSDQWKDLFIKDGIDF